MLALFFFFFFDYFVSFLKVKMEPTVISPFSQESILRKSNEQDRFSFYCLLNYFITLLIYQLTSFVYGKETILIVPLYSMCSNIEPFHFMIVKNSNKCLRFMNLFTE